nr:transposase [Nitrosomonas communis]
MAKQSNKQYVTEATVAKVKSWNPNHLAWKGTQEGCRNQKDKKGKQCKRRAAIEALIGHLKSDFRWSRNYLKGVMGDHVNLLMAVCAWNLNQWLLAIFWLLFPWLLERNNHLISR